MQVAFRVLSGRELTARLARRSAVQLYHGDSRAVLATLDADSLDSCVTDPPYALVSIVKRFGSATAAPAKGNEAYMRASAGFMGKTWDTGEAAMDPEFWRGVLRVLKPGAHLVAFGASRGYHRMACAIEDAGFEIRDSLMWVYGSGFPKSHSIGAAIDERLGVGHLREIVSERRGVTKTFNIGATETVKGRDPVTAAYSAAAAWEGWGTALKPAFEPIVLARKPLSEGTVAANVLRWGTGGLNVAATRIGTESTRRTANAGTGNRENWRTGNEAGTHGSVAGRWPANVCHDGSDEVVAAFPSAPGQQAAVRGDEPSAASDGTVTGKRARIASGEPRLEADRSAARFFYSAKASKADRAGSKHPTVKPIALMAWLTRLVTPPGGTVLDPFAGSGTTGAACVAEGFRAVLVEREAEYVADIRARLSGTRNDTHTQGRRIYGIFADERGVKGGRLDRRSDSG